MLLSLTAGLDFSAYALGESGSCGTNVTYTFDSETGTLTINGTGAMTNYSYDGSPFNNQYSIKKVIINSGVTSIGSYAFYSCTGLTSITIPDSVTSIENSAFKKCSSLTSVTISDNVTSIGAYAFYDCTGLKELTMPCSAKIYNSQYTFYNCTNIEKVTLTKGTGTMQNYQTDSAGSATNTYYQYTPWYISRNNLKELIMEYGITNIGSSAFEGCTGLTSITIPDSVKTIDYFAFSGCTGLTSITIGDGVTNIRDYVFYNCTNLTNVSLPNHIMDFGEGAIETARFYQDENNWQNGVLYIDNHLVKAKATITASYSIKPGTKYIDNNAFAGVTSLSFIEIPESTIAIGDYAFNYCTGLIEVEIDNGVTKIGNNAFRFCAGLTMINFGISVETIGASAFEGCTSLKSVDLPDSVETINSKAFYGCTGLLELKIPVSAKFYSAFGYCKNIKRLVLSKGNGIMQDYSINSYQDTPWYISGTNLKTIVIEEGVTNIGEVAFRESGITSISLPKSIKSIALSSFYDCNSLKNVFYSGRNEDWNTITINNLNDSLLAANVLYNQKISSNLHSIVKVDYIPATCTESGIVTKSKCSICGKVFSEPYLINPIGHTEVIDPERKPTGTSTGLTEGSHCSVCGEVLVAQEIVPALIPEGASVAVNGDKAVITLSDGSTITVPKDTKETVKNADGTYTVTFNDGSAVTVSSNTEITKTADGQLNVKATDNGKTTTVTVPSGSSVVKDGDSYKVIVVNGTETVEKTVAAGETVVIDKSGSMSCNGNHKYDKGVVTIAATCTSEGVKTYTCSVCGNQKIEKLNKVAHKPVADKAVPATFISAGKTAGTHCSVCGKVIVAQKPIAKLGAAALSKVKKGKKSFTAMWNPVANIDGYEIQYSLKKNMKKAKTKSVASSKKKVKIKKLKAKKNYYVRIRAYKVINGKKQYSAWSAKKKVKTK